jgi:hypothetical protein
MSVQIAETINRWVIPQWLALNYPEFIQNNGTAQIVIQGFADEDVAFTQQILQLIGQQTQGINKLLTMVDLQKILDDAGVPLLDVKAQQAQIAQIANQQQQPGGSAPNPVAPSPNSVGVVPSSQAPATTPASAGNEPGATDPGGTTGDNPTGFTYIQPREVIYLSSGSGKRPRILVKHEDPGDGVLARFDPEANTVYFGNGISLQDEQAYLKQIGEALAA